MTSTSDQSINPETHPLDEPRAPVSTEPPPVVHQGRGLGVNRHLGSVVLSFLGVLGAYGALDYGFFRANAAAQLDFLDEPLPDSTMIALAAAGVCLLVAAGAGRISGLGPLLAGLILGAAPTAWIFVDFGSFVQRLDDVPEAWNNTTFGLSYISFAVFPGVAGLLLGAALAGRWRRPPVTPRVVA